MVIIPIAIAVSMTAVVTVLVLLALSAVAGAMAWLFSTRLGYTVDEQDDYEFTTTYEQRGGLHDGP